MSDDIQKTVTFNAGAPTRVQSAGGHFARWVLVILGGAACLMLALVSGYFNVRFSQRLAMDGAFHEYVAWTVFAIGTDIFNSAMPIAFGELRHSRDKLWAWVCAGLWALGFSWSLVASFGFAVTSRDHRTAVAGDTIATRADSRAVIDTSRAQLAALGTVRPAAAVQADLDEEYRRLGVAPARCARVTDWSDRNCREAWRLATELERAKSAERLTADIARERGRMEGVAVAGTVADPQAAALEFLTGLPQRAANFATSAFAALMLNLFAAFGPAAVWNGARALREVEEQAPPAAPEPVDTAPALTSMAAGFARWAPEHIAIEAGARMTSQQAYASYRSWAPMHGCDVGTKEGFGRLLADYASAMGVECKKQSHAMAYPNFRLIDGPKISLVRAAE